MIANVVAFLALAATAAFGLPCGGIVDAGYGSCCGAGFVGTIPTVTTGVFESSVVGSGMLGTGYGTNFVSPVMSTPIVASPMTSMGYGGCASSVPSVVATPIGTTGLLRSGVYGGYSGGCFHSTLGRYATSIC